MKTRKLALNAVLAAMCAALGALALDLNSIKITFESFPILLGALLFGPLDGLAVGFVGTLLYQLLRYGRFGHDAALDPALRACGARDRLLRQAPRLFAHDRTDGRHRRGRRGARHGAQHARHVHRRKALRLLVSGLHLGHAAAGAARCAL